MIRLKSLEDIEKLRLSGKILAGTFRHLEPHLKPGISTWDIDCMADEFIRSRSALPSFHRYRGFPGHICTSVNEVVIHGIPDKKQILKEGDIIGLDIGVNLDGYFTDSAKTYGIGKVSEADRKLMDVTEQSLMYAISELAPPNRKGRIKDIGKAVTRFVEPHGYGIVDNFCGHGVGFEVHEDPSVFNCHPSPGLNPRLREGMVLAIEPMVCFGTHEVDIWDDDFTVVTLDGKNAAHFEHTIAVFEDRLEILTLD
ncbi:type I methionyl aminopeptidase [Candidatus Haliotispira prima]|uniref:Methionine aminopeptidase n=1 Tax=Candidatus Haliotispira prima TaxID=3034016 RepID=A0ABY8MF75_9SPIO|nr:type I methionyl aminopeptidase [Candidatus Haliotispira prima]